MQKLQNYTLQKFLDNFIEELKYENKNRVYYCKKEFDIPFIISSLYQSFESHTDAYKEFIADLKKDNSYSIVINNPNDEYEVVNVSIYIHKFNEEFQIEEDLDYHYNIVFYYDERNYGYCECAPDMKDYREDKHCCGHGCDATFCRFELVKVSSIYSDSWNGDEHDYWDFEDEFYVTEKELVAKKAEEDRLRKIEELKNQIETASKKLAELENKLNEIN